jgi:murein DD-endopeptidase MepM/ murein hydrolase activator NlpD
VARLVGVALLTGCPADPPEAEPEVPPGGLWDESAPHPQPPSDNQIALFPPADWADWPVENVSPAAWFGWRLEPSGQYARASGVRVTGASNLYVVAIADGTVRETRLRDDGSLDVHLIHTDGTESRYHPLSASLVYTGMPVIRGTVLGLVDSAEMTLEVWIGGTEVDPLVVLRSPLQSRRLSPP